MSPIIRHHVINTRMAAEHGVRIADVGSLIAGRKLMLPAHNGSNMTCSDGRRVRTYYWVFEPNGMNRRSAKKHSKRAHGREV
ncbi:hypothetical protein V5F63_08225 [Xanthobacter autotrophicus DSM 597]|uniref:hypothetical protein n=1 Tax=Xanthobacter wiegelii TaxID=3119913 RepID=UPI00372C70D8